MLTTKIKFKNLEGYIKKQFWMDFRSSGNNGNIKCALIQDEL